LPFRRRIADSDAPAFGGGGGAFGFGGSSFASADLSGRKRGENGNLSSSISLRSAAAPDAPRR
jgi:hypothetical protein